jgi:site-specific recombinase XerD
MRKDLEPIPPAEAVNLYLNHREPELSEKTLENQRYRLRSFIRFCEEHGIESMHELTGRDLHRFRVWRRNGEGEDYEPVKVVTLHGVLSTLRTFLEFCANIDAVDDGFREKVKLPEVDRTDEAKDRLLNTDRAQSILHYMDRYRYASREHVIFAILWHTGIRVGTLRALDVQDFDPENRCLDVQHRPKTDTPLKNGEAARRSIAVGERYCQVIQDYIDHHRHDVTDEYNREPLITSSQGRLTQTPIRRIVYRWTQPCRMGECPHDKDPKTCEWTQRDELSKCPSARSPHDIRRGSITRQLRDGTPEEIVSERSNASEDVLDQHYDERSEREKMELRREFVNDA